MTIRFPLKNSGFVTSAWAVVAMRSGACAAAGAATRSAAPREIRNLRKILPACTCQHNCQGEKQKPSCNCTDSPVVKEPKERYQPKRLRVVGRRDYVPAEKPRIQNAGEGASGDQTGAEQRAGADF